MDFRHTMAFALALAGLAALPAAPVQAQACNVAQSEIAALDLSGLELSRSEQIAFHFDVGEWRAGCGDIAAARSAYAQARALIAATPQVEGAWALGLLTEARLEAAQRQFDRARGIIDEADAMLVEAGASRARDFLFLMETALIVEATASAAGQAHSLEAVQAELAALRDQVTSEDEAALTRDPEAGADADHVVVPVFYGVNRLRTGSDDPNAFYGAAAGPLDLGVVTVSVPRNREVGSIPRRGDYPGDIDQYRGDYFILERVEPFADDYAFTGALGEAMDASERRELLVFIHGFNSDFRGAAERAAQLAVDLEIDGVPALYSWPSRGSLLGYFADGREVNDQNVGDLVDYLYLLMSGANADRIHIVAHSMGNRFLARALERLAETYPNPPEPLIDQVVWASPDVDAQEFMALVPQVGHLAAGMTLYTSSRDRALRLSRRINGGAPRAGDSSPPYPVVLAGLSTVDTTAAGGRGLGHSDYAGPAMDDFRALIWLSLSPQERCILHTDTGQLGQFYAVDPQTGANCALDVFKYSITAMRRGGEDGDPMALLQSAVATPGAAITDRLDEVRILITRLMAGRQ